MSTKGAAILPVNPWVAGAIALWIKCPLLIVSQVMLTDQFISSDADDRSKQAWVYHRVPVKKSMRPLSVKLS